MHRIPYRAPISFDYVLRVPASCNFQGFLPSVRREDPPFHAGPVPPGVKALSFAADPLMASYLFCKDSAKCEFCPSLFFRILVKYSFSLLTRLLPFRHPMRPYSPPGSKPPFFFY